MPGEHRAATGRWAGRLDAYLRLVALLWLVRGLWSWAAILGIGGASQGFEGAALGAQGALVAFAVFDCVAAVGLWLASAWGSVMWLAVALLEQALPFALPRAVPPPGPLGLLSVALVLGYLVLTLFAARERGRLERA